jgi:hypothetical protein
MINRGIERGVGASAAWCGGQGCMCKFARLIREGAGVFPEKYTLSICRHYDFDQPVVNDLDAGIHLRTGFTRYGAKLHCLHQFKF